MKITVITSLYDCEKYLNGYFQSVEEIVNKDECEFLLLHNKPTKRELEIVNLNIQGRPWYHHIIIEEREGLYTTWNRAIHLARGEYCAIWNVDDIRSPDSLLLQKEALENYPESVISFGDIWGTEKYGKQKDIFYFHPTMEEEKEEYFKRHIIGCFPMWRKTIHSQIGYFDEQFKLVADFEFQIRVAIKYSIKKIYQPTGYYLILAKEKLSSDTKLQIKESNIVHLRYGNFDKINLLYLYASLRNFSVFNIRNKNEKVSIFYFYTKHWIFLLLKSYRILGQLYRFPIDILKFIKHEYLDKID
ncbi:MAG: glycosyltransferase [Candidatus Thorarchaeota archaeon]